MEQYDHAVLTIRLCRLVLINWLLSLTESHYVDNFVISITIFFFLVNYHIYYNVIDIGFLLPTYVKGVN